MLLEPSATGLSLNSDGWRNRAADKSASPGWKPEFDANPRAGDGCFPVSWSMAPITQEVSNHAGGVRLDIVDVCAPHRTCANGLRNLAAHAIAGIEIPAGPIRERQ